MLNLSVNFMKIRLLSFLALFLIAAQDAPSIAISSPVSGDIIYGKVTISGTTDILGFASSQLDFSYASNLTNTWFAIQTSAQPITDSSLAVWDTTFITDGDYVLRLRVFVEDGSFQEAIVPVKVQNDSPIISPTAIVTSTPDKLDIGLPTPFLVAPSPTPTLTPHPTPTLLPTNPVSMNRISIYTSLGRGALVIIGLFAFVGLIFRFRRY